MRKIKYKKGKKVQPVFLEYTGVHTQIKTEIDLHVYDNLNFVQYNKVKLEALDKLVNTEQTSWLSVVGINQTDKIKTIGDYLQIDNFILGDILNTIKRTKFEEYNDTLFFSIKSLLPIENSDTFEVEQISFILKHGLLVSFEEKSNNFFNHIRQRIATHSGIVRTKHADYLLFLLLDAIIENFYITIETEEEKIEEIINLVKTKTSLELLDHIEKHRDNLNFLKRAIIPLRESLYAIKSVNQDSILEVIEPKNYTFFDRLHQKCLELLEQIEYDLSTLESTSTYFFSAQSQKMNEVMKTLTVVSVFFMPLTFIVGVYGMNFDNMPELHWKYGYFIIVGAMVILFLAMVYYFKKKNWY